MKVSEILKAALASLDEGRLWRGGENEGSPGACCAAHAAFIKCKEHGVASSMWVPVHTALAKNLNVADGPDVGLTGIWSWNDALERTWPEVKAAYERAIAAAEKAEAAGAV